MSLQSHIMAAFAGWLVINYVFGACAMILAYREVKFKPSLRVALWMVVTWPWQVRGLFE